MNRVSEVLTDNNIDHELIRYDEVLATAEEAATKLGWQLSQIVKTLVVKGKRTGFHIVLVPGGKSIDWNKLAKALDDRKVHLATPDEVTEQTGYIIGSVSPLGTKNLLPIVMEKTILEEKKIGINGGERGVEIILEPHELQKTVQATIYAICR